jgi:hypothetical protein
MLGYAFRRFLVDLDERKLGISVSYKLLYKPLLPRLAPQGNARDDDVEMAAFLVLLQSQLLLQPR